MTPEPTSYVSGLDQPMELGEHLHELRRRLFLVLIGIGLVTIVAFGFQHEIKILVGGPLQTALRHFTPEDLQQIGLEEAGGIYRLRADTLVEPTVIAAKLSVVAAIVLMFPVLIYQLWSFIRPALKRSEATAAFWFLPAATLFFYAGLAFGYFFGVPGLYYLLIDFNLSDPTVTYNLRMNSYVDFFILLTMVFGFLLDIPWLIMLLVRCRIVTPRQLAMSRKFIVGGGAVAAALVTPPDPFSLVIVLIMIAVLFEVGLFAGRLMVPKTPPKRSYDEGGS